MKIFNFSKRLAITTLGLLFVSASAFGQYCTPTYTTGTIFGDYCGYVGLGTIDNPTDGAPAPYYSDYTYLSTDVALGASYTITLGSGSYTSNNDFGVWIDYNQDNDFYDADELVGTVLDLGAFASGTATFSIPLTAVGGSTRMRVREIYAMPITPDPCASYSYGETEDYTVNIMGGSMNDVGIIDITNPTSGVDLALEDVIVTIYNYGSEPASEFNVYYQVDGGIATGGAFLGTIAPYSTASYTMPEGWDFSVVGCYNITAWTEMEIDEDLENDIYEETVCHLGPITGTGAMYIYSNSTGGEPWFQVTNTTAMNTIFGAEGIGWTRAYFETVDPLTAFSPDNCFVFIEGSDSHAIELESFLAANIGTIEDWVSSGGKLLLNSAPNEGDGMSFGFDGTNLIYDGGSGLVTAADASHPIFNGPMLPVGTDFTGSNFSHARISGIDITSVIIETGSTDITLGEKIWGDGMVMFGGMTTNNFHTPLTEAANLRANILAYLSCIEFAVCEIPGGLFADGITTNDAVLHWDAVDGADQYRVTLQNVATGLIKTKGYYINMVEITDKLTPLTEYAFRVKTVCYDDLGLISAPSPWYYFTTLGRIGENENASVLLYPNPNTGVFNLNVNGYADNQFELNVSNSMGQIIYTKSITINNADYNEQINLTNAAPGMYQISLKNNDLNLNYSVVITE